ncbi:MAG: Gfo/Idh/MocA family protein [Bryobacteraceae bacterium]
MDRSISRREMIGAGLAAMGAAPAAAQAGPVNVGVIGVGLRSGAHLNALKQLQGESKITALCDLESARMQKAAQGLPSRPEMYTDYRELLKDKNVGAVAIVTPGYLHHEMTLAALRAGKDVMLEKPLAMNYKEAVDIIRAARRSGRVVCVGMQRRYSRGDAEIRRIVESGAIGPVKFINYEEYRNDWNPRTSLVDDPKTGRKVSWRLLARTSGSSELEFSIHALAMVTSIVNSPLVRLSASGGVVHYKDRDTRDVSSLLAEFANGARLNYSFTCFSRAAGGKLLIIGDKGVIRRDGGKLQMSATLDGPLQPVKASGDDEGSAEVQMYREFLENVRKRTPSPLSPEAALEPSKLAYGADISIRENRFVTARDFPAI